MIFCYGLIFLANDLNVRRREIPHQDFSEHMWDIQIGPEVGPTFQVLGVCFGGLADCLGAQQCTGWQGKTDHWFVGEIMQRKFHNQIIHIDTRYWRISCLCAGDRNWAEQMFNLFHDIWESGRCVFWSKKHILLHDPVNQSLRNSADLSFVSKYFTSTSSLAVMCQTRERCALIAMARTASFVSQAGRVEPCWSTLKWQVFLDLGWLRTG